MSVGEKKALWIKHTLACSCRLASPQHPLCPVTPENLSNKESKAQIWKCQVFNFMEFGSGVEDHRAQNDL